MPAELDVPARKVGAKTLIWILEIRVKTIDRRELLVEGPDPSRCELGCFHSIGHRFSPLEYVRLHM